MLTPRPCWVRAWACSLGYAPVRMELTPSANKVLSFCANVDMELCLGSEKRSPAWLQISLSVFFCLVHLHRFKGVDGGAGERWWELRIFSPLTPPKELRLGSACSRDGAALLSLWYLWARKRTRWEDGREQTPLLFLQFLNGCDSYTSFTELSSVRWPLAPN